MKDFIVEQYSTPNSLEEGLNSHTKVYFPFEILSNKDYYTVVYCKKSILKKQGVEITTNDNPINKLKQ